MAAEGDPAVVHLAQVAEAEHLVAAAVGEDRAGPAGERVDPAEALDRVHPRPQGQMVEVRQHDRGARRLELVRADPLTAPRVPTGMKAGVSTTPWGDGQPAQAGGAVLGEDLERERHRSWLGKSGGPEAFRGAAWRPPCRSLRPTGR